MKLRILVIDDDECIRDTLKWHLEGLGHEVIVAPEPMLCDVYKGDCCIKGRPCADLALIDFRMPRMTGLEFIELMAKHGCNSLPSSKILMSGDTSSIDMEKVQQLGCRLVQKPFKFDQLDEILRQVLERVEPDRQLADLSKKN